MKLLEKAIWLALTCHRGQIKSETGEPYILHCIRVMMKMETEQERITAVLHDSIEKSSLTLNKLKSDGFPVRIIKAIDALSKRKNEQYSDYIMRVKSNPLAVKVKIADFEDNADLRYVKTNDGSTVEKFTKRKKYLRELRKIYFKLPY